MIFPEFEKLWLISSHQIGCRHSHMTAWTYSPKMVKKWVHNPRQPHLGTDKILFAQLFHVYTQLIAPHQGSLAMILDMRCRLTTEGTADYFHNQLNKHAPALSSSLKEGSIEAFFADISASGITTAVSVSGNNPGGRIGKKLFPDRTTPNDLLAQVQKQYPGRFIGVAGIDASNTFHNALDEIERCVVTLGLKAVFIEPGRAPGCLLNDPCLYPIYDKCSQLGIPIIPQTSGLYGGKTIDYAHPKYIDQIAADFPDLHIICGHGCYPYVREAIVVAARNEHVWMSPDLFLLHGLGASDWVQAVNSNLHGFANKFIFGSGYPMGNLNGYVKNFHKIPWNKDVLERILYRNALRALKLDTDPVFRALYQLE
jgi:predicted TIM-barrel fold metal-dependent hydrolase